MQVQGIRSLFVFPEYVVTKMKVTPIMAEVHLRRDKRYTEKCPECATALKVNRHDVRTVRDLPFGPTSWVLLRIPVVQGYCATCNSFVTLLPDGLLPNAQATNRFKRYISTLAQYMPLSAVSEITSVPEASVYRWDREVLEKTLPPPNLDNLKYLLVDEKQVRKGHGYVTLVMNGENGELLHMAEGKKKESLESFFDLLNKGQKETLEAVAMDRLGSYYKVVKEQLPEADIVFDKFHLIASYHKALDALRREEWRNASIQDKAFIKGQRYNLFRTEGTHTEEQEHTLMKLLEANRNLMVAYCLKDALYPVWTYRYRAWAKRYLEQWLGWLYESKIAQLKELADSFGKVKDEIVNFCKHPITTGPLESFNNTVSRIIHRACGVKNMDYLFLKLRQKSLTRCQQS